MSSGRQKNQPLALSCARLSGGAECHLMFDKTHHLHGLIIDYRQHPVFSEVTRDGIISVNALSTTIRLGSF